MNRIFPLYFLLAMAFFSCATRHPALSDPYQHAAQLATYRGPTTDMQDGYLVLTKNGYFKFYEEACPLYCMKDKDYFGRFSQTNDTLYLDWQGTDPKKVKHFLSRKCVVDTATKSLSFIDEVTNQRLWKITMVTTKHQGKVHRLSSNNPS